MQPYTQHICVDCHRFIPKERAEEHEVCFKCEMVRLLKTKIDTTRYDFSQPVVYRRKRKV